MSLQHTGPLGQSQLTLTDAAIMSLTSRLRGELIRPNGVHYEDARKVYNAMIDRYPQLIIRCANIGDVVAAVNFARDYNLPLAIRGGGHNVAGYGTCDDGLVLDLGAMKGVWIDPEKRRAMVQGGCTWGDLDHATYTFGLATPGGLVSTTGVAGLTLGGGIGHLSRKHGLSCDSLLSAQVVTADGRVLTASPEENEDLFWGLRGGGGNFGVVTSFEFQLYPISTVLSGQVIYAIEQCEAVLRFYRDFMADAPEELSAFFAFHKLPPDPLLPSHLHYQTVCGVICCYAGSLERGEEMVRPLQKFGPPIFEHIERMPYPALQRAFDDPPGMHNYWKADYMVNLSDAAIAAHAEYGPQIPTVQSFVHIYPTDGAIQHVGQQETAYSHREANFVHLIAAASPEPAEMPGATAWVQEYWRALHPYASGGSYVNFLMDDQIPVQTAYRENYERLVKLKNKYDPTNLFRINQNIKPTV